MPEPTSCCLVRGGYCDRCDLLVGLDGLRVIGVERDDGGGLAVTVESEPEVMGCPTCGVVAHAHGRVRVGLVDAPSAGRPVRIVWCKRLLDDCRQDRRLARLGSGDRREALQAAAHQVRSVWLTSGLRPAGHRDEAWLKKGLPCS